MENNLLIKVSDVKSSHNSLISSLLIFINNLDIGEYTENDISRRLDITVGENFSGKVVENLLNSLAKDSSFKFFWEMHNNVTDLTSLKMNATTAIDNANPVMVNTVSSPGDIYLRGHNTGYRLSNFGLITGYSEYGDKVVYLESGYGRFNGFTKSQTVDIKDLSYALEAGGYVW